MKVVHSYNLLILYKQYENVIEKKMLSNSQQPLKMYGRMQTVTCFDLFFISITTISMI